MSTPIAIPTTEANCVAITELNHLANLMTDDTRAQDYKEDDGPLLIRLMKIDVSAVDKAWQNQKDYYLAPNTNTEKYLASRRELLAGKIIEAPFLDINEDSSLIVFIDGRHRFANMRDLGAKWMFAWIEERNLDSFRLLLYVEN